MVLIIEEKQQQIEALETPTAAQFVHHCRFLDEVTYLELPITDSLDTFQEACRARLKKDFSEHPKTILYFLQKEDYDGFDKRFDNIVVNGLLGWSQEDKQALYYLGASRLKDEEKAIAYSVVVNPETQDYWVYYKVLDYYKNNYPESVPKRYLDLLWKQAKSEYERTAYFNSFYTLDDEVVNFFKAELDKEDNTLGPVIEAKLYAAINDASKIDELVKKSEEHYALEATLEVLVKNPPAELDINSRVKYYKQWTDANWANDLLLTEWFSLAKSSGFEVLVPPVKSLSVTAALLLFVFFCPLLIIIPVHYVGLIRERHHSLSEPVYPNITLLSFLLLLGGVFLGDTVISLTVMDLNVLASYFNPYYEDVSNTNIAQFMLYSTVFTVLLALIVVNKKLFGLLHPENRPTVLRIASATSLCVLICFASAILIQVSGPMSNTVIITEFIQAVIQEYGLWVSLFVIAVLGPIFEEILCRAVILNSTQRHLGFWFANTLQAGVFMFLHMDSELYLYYFIVGFLAGLLYRFSKTLYAPIFMHIAINTIAVLTLAATLPTAEESTEDIEKGSALANCLNLDVEKPYKGFLDCNLAAEQGHVEGINRAASFVFTENMPGDHVEYAFNTLIRAGDKVDKAGHYLLSRIYFASEQFEDSALYMEHLRRSAEDGFPAAQTDLAGVILYSGKVEDIEDIEYAVRILEDAVEQDFTPARNQLAWFYATTGYNAYRNGSKALEIMLPMPPLDQMPYAWIDTLAASYAATRDFEEAISLQQQAIDKARAAGVDTDSVQQMQEQLLKFTRGEQIRSEDY